MERIKTILYNAISLLIDETYEQYDDQQEWFTMLLNELGCTNEELKEYGIHITPDGDLNIFKLEMVKMEKNND